MSLTRTRQVYGLAARVIPFCHQSLSPSAKFRLHHFDRRSKYGPFLLSIQRFQRENSCFAATR